MNGLRIPFFPVLCYISIQFSNSAVNSWVSLFISLRFSFSTVKCMVCIIIHMKLNECICVKTINFSFN